MADLTDLEITKLCAEAMGLHITDEAQNGHAVWVAATDVPAHEAEYVYDPLRKDAQAMALVKKFKLEPRFAGKIGTSWHGQWLVTQHNAREPLANHSDLNRAICECVAKMQREKANG